MVSAEAVPAASSVVVETQPVVVVAGQPAMPSYGMMPDYTKGASVLKAVPTGDATKLKKAWTVVDQNGQLLGYIRVRLDRKPVKEKTGKAVAVGALGWFCCGPAVGLAAGAITSSALKGAKFPEYGIQFYPVENMIKPGLDCQVMQNAMGMSEWTYLDRENVTFAREASLQQGSGKRAEVVERWIEVDCKASGTAVRVAISGQATPGRHSDSRFWTVPGRPDLPLGVFEMSHSAQPVGKFTLMEGASVVTPEARNCLMCQLMTRLAGSVCARR